MVLDEIFSQSEYEPPDEAEVALAQLPPARRVVDLGANIGLFGAWTLGRLPDAAIVAVEADAGNAAIHRRTIEANSLEERWRLFEGFATVSPGTVRFASGSHATSHLALATEEWVEVPALDVFPQLADADLVKIDIEGAEWELLADPRFNQIRPRVVVLEYHEDRCPSSDPSAAADQALRRAGFTVVHAGRKPQFGAGLLWAFAAKS